MIELVHSNGRDKSLSECLKCQQWIAKDQGEDSGFLSIVGFDVRHGCWRALVSEKLWLGSGEQNNLARQNTEDGTPRSGHHFQVYRMG